MRLILASTSPRRKELLSLLEVPFEVADPDLVEELAPNIDAARQAKMFAERKARSCAEKAPDALVLAAAQSKLDVAVLAWAVGAARRLRALGKIALISAPVHAETLAWVKTRHAYVDVLSQIEPQLLSLIAPRIVGFDSGSNLGQVSQWTSALRRHVRAVFVHLPGTNFDFSGAGNLGATGFGLTAHANRATLGEEAGRLARIADDQNGVSYIDNVISTAELSILKRKGIRFVSGPLIGLPADLAACLRAPAWEKAQLAASA